MEGARSSYRGGQFNGGRIVMLRRWSEWRENGYVTEVVSLMQREWSYYTLMQGDGHVIGGHFKGGRAMLWRWPVNGGGMVKLEGWPF